jgi:hypothetical protein
MALSWLNALEQLQSQFKGLAEVEKFAEKDFQWVDDVCAEATALFQKDNEEKDDKNNDANEEDPNESGMGPVLLPQTPRVNKTEFLFETIFECRWGEQTKLTTGTLTILGEKGSRWATADQGTFHFQFAELGDSLAFKANDWQTFVAGRKSRIESQGGRGGGRQKKQGRGDWGQNKEGKAEQSR